MTPIALLNIGSELLSGRTINTNASEIGVMLRTAGYHLNVSRVIHDEGPIILSSINELLADHDVVLITGGLGPTKDDITKKILLDRFGGEMVCHEPTLARIKSYLESRKRRLLEANRLQAEVPSSCQVLDNLMGTAPGMAFFENGKVVISMPGVPFEMRHLMEEQVLPLLIGRYPRRFSVRKIVRTAGIPESRIAERMEEVEPTLPPDIGLAYLPSYDGTKIELRAYGDATQQAEAEARVLQAQEIVARTFSKYVYALEDKTPAELLTAFLLSTGTTFATAESCTGGAIAAAVVEHSGVSSVMRGGVVAYQRQIKEQVLGVPPEVVDTYGIVSAEVAAAMAEGARKLLASDYAVSITGIAEAAADASPEEMPQAWMGLAGPQGTRTLHFRMFKGRVVNIHVATQAALVFALRGMRADAQGSEKDA